MSSDRIAAAKAVIQAHEQWTGNPMSSAATDFLAFRSLAVEHGPDLAALCLEQATRIERLEAGLRPFVEWWDSPNFALTSKASQRLGKLIDAASSLLAGSAPVATPTFADGVKKAMEAVEAKRKECERKRVVPGDLERNYFGGGMRACEEIAAALSALLENHG